MDRWDRKHSDSCRSRYYSGFLNFCEKHLPELEVAEDSMRERDPESFYRTKVQAIVNNECIEA